MIPDDPGGADRAHSPRIPAPDGAASSSSPPIALLTETPDEVLMEREVSLRLLRHIASSLRHQPWEEPGESIGPMELGEAA